MNSFGEKGSGGGAQRRREYEAATAADAPEVEVDLVLVRHNLRRHTLPARHLGQNAVLLHTHFEGAAAAILLDTDAVLAGGCAGPRRAGAASRVLACTVPADLAIAAKDFFRKKS